MSNQIMISDVKMNSVQLVDMINSFRKLEKNRKSISHSNLMKKIRTEIDILNEHNLISEDDIRETTYTNKQNKSQPSYLMSRDVVIQILSSESVLVRAKVLDYINKLEEEVMGLTKDNLELDGIARSVESIEDREYNADLVKYSWRNIRNLIMDADYKTLEDTVDDVIEFHTVRLKKSDRARYKSHTDSNYTEYKQMVRDRLYDLLKDKQVSQAGNVITTTLIYSITDDLLKEKIKTANRSNGRIISELKSATDKKIPIKDFTKLDVHGMTANALYYGNKMTQAYIIWLKKFPFEQVPSRESFEREGVDFDKPIRFRAKFIHKEAFDVDNLIKSFVDVLFNEDRGHFGIDDNIIREIQMESIGHCDDFPDGKMYFHIENI